MLSPNKPKARPLRFGKDLDLYSFVHGSQPSNASFFENMPKSKELRIPVKPSPH